jgi:LmbE family N-acetylglucosaminyl deacetylase
LTGGNGARFAAMPLSGGGTPVQEWLIPETLPALDLTECPGLIVVAPHPDDETLGLGAMAAQLAASGVDVRVVSVSDGGAADPGAPPSLRTRLESTRRNELRRATGILGVPTPMSLGLPDGQLEYHEDGLTDALVEILDDAAPGSWCAATWRGDGHPDHETVGRAAAAACARSGATLLEYPVWMWHWASPTDPAVPWDHAYSVPVPTWARDRKHNAAQCFRSQFEASAQGAAPTLPAFVLQRLLAVGELVFR